jgi:hypothetical protein
MGISGVSSLSRLSAGLSSNDVQAMRQNLQALRDALGSNKLADAQKAFATFIEDMAAAGPSGQSGERAEPQGAQAGPIVTMTGASGGWSVGANVNTMA